MLEVQELTKKYGKNVAVDHVSFMVQDGQVGAGAYRICEAGI